jgi:hypothetical protein
MGEHCEHAGLPTAPLARDVSFSVSEPAASSSSRAVRLKGVSLLSPRCSHTSLHVFSSYHVTVPSSSGGFEKIRIVSSTTEEACNATGMEEFTRSLERKILETNVKPIKPPKHLLSLIGRAIGSFLRALCPPRACHVVVAWVTFRTQGTFK